MRIVLMPTFSERQLGVLMGDASEPPNGCMISRLFCKIWSYFPNANQALAGGTIILAIVAYLALRDSQKTAQQQLQAYIYVAPGNAFAIGWRRRPRRASSASFSSITSRSSAACSPSSPSVPAAGASTPRWGGRARSGRHTAAISDIRAGVQCPPAARLSCTARSRFCSKAYC
jgi:hypothetical protein